MAVFFWEGKLKTPIKKLFEEKNWLECIQLIKEFKYKTDENCAILGSCYQFTGNLEKAQHWYKESLSKNGNNANACHNLGNILAADSHEKEEGIALLKRAVSLDNENPKFLYSLLSALHKNKLQSESVDIAIAATTLHPTDKLLAVKAGVVLIQNKRRELALETILKALKYHSTDSLLLTLLADLNNLNEPIEAIKIYKKILEQDPENLTVIFCLGKIYADRGPYDQAEKYISEYLKKENDVGKKYKASQILMHSAAKSCEWKDVSNQLDFLKKYRDLGSIISPFMFLSIDDDPAQHKINSEKLAGLLENHPVLFKESQKYKAGKIRLGYISGDFYNHATMNLMKSLFGLHDKREFEIIGFNLLLKKDRTYEEVSKYFDEMVDLTTLTTKARVDRIRDYGLDIAMDLKGHTSDSDMAILHARVAPIQITHIGYPGTSGIKNIDYILADERVIPKEMEIHYSEKVLRMPFSYQVNNSQRSTQGSKYDKEYYGLPRDAFVFNNFNQNYKITRYDIDIWSEILGKVPNSVMWLMSTAARAEGNIRSAFFESGVERERIIFARRVNIEEHLGRHEFADLVLDTKIYNAHTTGSDALWFGVPIVTHPGKSFASRVGASLLYACGLNELIVQTKKEYVDTAVRYANDESYRSHIKNILKIHNSALPLFNTENWTRDFEELLRSLIQ